MHVSDRIFRGTQAINFSKSDYGNIQLICICILDHVNAKKKKKTINYVVTNREIYEITSFNLYIV